MCIKILLDILYSVQWEQPLHKSTMKQRQSWEKWWAESLACKQQSKAAHEINGTFMRYQMTHQIHLACASIYFFSLLSMGMGYSKHTRLRMLTKAHFSRLASPNNLAHGQSGSDLGSALILRGFLYKYTPFLTCGVTCIAILPVISAVGQWRATVLTSIFHLASNSSLVLLLM